jgi:hypothetical protein
MPWPRSRAAVRYRREQKRGPVDRVKAQDVFADEMQRRPELLKADRFLALFVSETDRGDVIRQRVEPDVHRVRRIVRHRHAPTHRSLQTTHRQILKPPRTKLITSLRLDSGLTKSGRSQHDNNASS